MDPFNGAVVHTGDNRSGEGDGDDETVNIDADVFAMMKPRVEYLFIVVNSFSGSSFRSVKAASCRVIAAKTQTELARCVMSIEDRKATAMVVGRLRRTESNEWYFCDVNVAGYETCFGNLCPLMQGLLRDQLPNIKIAPVPTGLVMTK